MFNGPTPEGLLPVAHSVPVLSYRELVRSHLRAYGKPLLTYKVIVQLIAATTTSNGLTLACAIDARRYPKGGKVSKAQFDALKIRYDAFHPDWNYSILPIRTA